MKPSEVLPLHREKIRQLVLEAGMANPRVFGSVARGEDNEESDLDILVDAGPGISLLTMVHVQQQLQDATGVKIDLRTPGDLHPRFREKVLAEVELI
jgi:predicted nucleotidyltransferase